MIRHGDAGKNPKELQPLKSTKIGRETKVSADYALFCGREEFNHEKEIV